MKTPPNIPREDERLHELRAYDVLDSADEQAFNDLTYLATVICRTPIALVSLVDQERQWFKSRVGLAASQTPRDISFCGHAIAIREIFEVKDAYVDERFHDNPLVTGEPRVRFYAGAQLITARGLAIGTLCVIGHEPRSLDGEQRKALKALARQVVSQLERRKLVNDAFSRIGDLARSEERLRDLITHLENTQRAARIGSWEIDLTSNRESWSSEQFRIFEVERSVDATLLHAKRLARMPQAAREQFLNHVAAARERGVEFEMDHTIIFEDGRKKDIRTIGRVVRGEKGEPVSIIGTSHDRTVETVVTAGKRSVA